MAARRKKPTSNDVGFFCSTYKLNRLAWPAIQFKSQLRRKVGFYFAPEYVYPNIAVRKIPPLAIMKKIIGIDSMVLVREARNAMRRAFAFSSSVAGFMPRIFFW